MGLNAIGPQGDSVLQESASLPAASFRSQPWYGAYMAALFETNRGRIGERIRYAEQLIVARERELFNAERDPVEQRSLHNALHALRALRSCLGI